MVLSRGHRYLATPILLLLAVGGAQGQEEPDEPPVPADLEAGRVHYMASCARCHGVDGGGGEGPPLARSDLPRAPTDAALMRIVAAGIPGTAMPRSWWLSGAEVRAVVAYVRSLAPRTDAGLEPSGDPERGRALYEELRCGSCHTVGGFGTSRGPDLTTVGNRRGQAYLREAVLTPGAALPKGQTAIAGDFYDYLPVRIVTTDGTEVRGARMNEDSYTIQIRDQRGALRSYYKPGLRELSKLYDSSLMRSYRDRLNDEELEDLIAYLMSLTGAARVIS